MEEKLNLSVILPIKSAVVKDFDEFFDKAIVLNDVKFFVCKNIIDSECWGESIISIADAWTQSSKSIGHVFTNSVVRVTVWHVIEISA